jgi:hypothetical protein
LFAVLLSLCLSAVAAMAEPVFPPGSRIGLEPPKGMELSKRFTGFENPDKAASITLAEMPAEAYPKLVAGFAKDVLQKQGVTVTAHEQLKVAGRPATFVAGEQGGGSKVRRWVLAVNEPTVTAFVVAQARSDQGYSDKEMRAALTSVALRAPLPMEEQMAPLPFRLGNRAGFRPVRVLSGNALLMTEGPKDVIKDVEQPFLVLASGTGPVPPTEELRERFAKAALAANQTLKDFSLERSQGFRLGGVDWHEIVAKAKDTSSGRPVVVMQTIRFSPGASLRMIGVAPEENREKLLPRFRSVIDSVTMKES